jgi:L-arabinose isomerase
MSTAENSSAWSSQTSIGFLPLDASFLEESVPGFTERAGRFCEEVRKTVEEWLLRENVVLITPPEGRTVNTEAAVKGAVDHFEKAGCDGIIVLFLSYSPSLNLVGPFSKTLLPLIFLDTTGRYDFMEAEGAEELMLNHGIHGVQDICSLLARAGKPYIVEAGHMGEQLPGGKRGECLKDKLIDRISQVRLASAFSKERVGLIGDPLEGMGDFRVDFDVLRRRTGVEVVLLDLQELVENARDTRDTRNTRDTGEKNGSVSADNLALTLGYEAALRLAADRYSLTSFASNAFVFKEATESGVVPFYAFSRLLADGFGYAGEGDVVSAALTGALLKACEGKATFTEMFCPDWKQDRVLLSHVGEMNFGISDDADLIEKTYALTGTKAVALRGRYRSGKAVLLNLVPNERGPFRLIEVGGEVEETPDNPALKNTVRGWFRPDSGLVSMLEAYSYAGGTHHLALVYGQERELFSEFARLMSWEYIHI